VAAGKLGDVLNVSYFRGSDYPAYPGGPLTGLYRQGSYPFRDLGVHALYLLEAFLGEIRSLNVRHYGTGRDPMVTFDEWRMSAEGDSGTGEVLLSWNMLPVQNEIWVHGTRGVIHADAFLQQCHFYRTYPGPKQLHAIINGMRHAVGSLFGIPAFVIRAATGKIKPSPGIYASIIAFYNALAEGKPVPVPAEEGRRAIAWVANASRPADDEKDRIEAARAQERPAPARILVTGGSGFLGSALVRRLRERGERPRVLLRRPAAPGSAVEGLDAVYGSLGEPDAVERAVAGVEVVYHVGAAMKGGVNDFEAGTVWGTKNIVDSCLKYGVQRLVYVSSIGLLDHAGHPDGVPVTEGSPVEPHTELRGIYSKVKLEAERIVLNAIRDHGLQAVIIRPGQIFGPGAEQVTPNGVIRLAGQWIVAGSGKRPLPLIYVEDVVDGLIAAETAPEAPGKIIHLIDPSPITQNQYLEWCQPALGKTPVRRTPVALLMFAGWMCEVLARAIKRSLPLSRYRVRSLKPLFPSDVSRAREVLNWTPAAGSARGLEQTFSRYRKA
jgi:nucleoside-diphosphate-sugar epimerase